jgi:predicted RecA/RadA family phage recombinase
MATNMRRAYSEEKTASVVCSAPASPVTGDPVMVGQIPGVALTDEGEGGNSATTTTVAFDGDWLMSVKGENNGGNTAVAVGDILYYEAGQTPPLNKDSTAGIRWGYALEAVTSGATASIIVRCGY